MAWFNRLSERFSGISDGPGIYVMACGILGGAAVLLASLSPLLLAASVGAIAGAAVSVGAANWRKGRQGDESGETWKASAARIGAFCEGLEAERESDSTRFQTRVLDQERPSRCRLH